MPDPLAETSAILAASPPAQALRRMVTPEEVAEQCSICVQTWPQLSRAPFSVLMVARGQATITYARALVMCRRRCMFDAVSDQPETVISWRGIGAHAPVVASDGVEVGQVAEVAGLPEEDIFHGVVFTHHLLGHHFLAPANDIDRITERAVYLKSNSQVAEEYEHFQEMHIKRLGLSGLFRWKHLGWKDSSE
jgi:hypothetical protein